MARPKKIKFVENTPGVSYFKPRGIPLSKLEEVGLTVEELEALRLVEYLELQHQQAARKMRVSRTTFQRVLHSAHRKITDALINGRAIRIRGGNYQIKNNN